jgi:hypothetical protein
MTDEKREEAPQVLDEEAQMPLMIDEDASEDARAAGGRGRNQGADDEEETWTNQPATADQELLHEELEDGGEPDDEDVEPSRTPRKAIETARDVVCEELPDRAQRAALRLKPFLTGTFVFDFTNSGEKFVFDWRGDVPSTKQLPKAVTITCDEAQGFVSTESAINVDSVVSISESNLMAVRSGSLNPQVGMLTEKIRVRGKVGPAVYIFNVIAPRART